MVNSEILKCDFIKIHFFKLTVLEKKLSYYLGTSFCDISAVDNFFFTKHSNTNGRSEWATREIMLKNKSHLVTFHVRILVNQ